MRVSTFGVEFAREEHIQSVMGVLRLCQQWGALVAFLLA